MAGGETVLIDPEYDFGIIWESDGSVTGTAHVVNLGPDTTYVRDVRPSCGCTGRATSPILSYPATPPRSALLTIR